MLRFNALSNLADTFQVVPSQINYVIKRPALQKVVVILLRVKVEVAVIFIVKVRFSDKHHMINDLSELRRSSQLLVFTDLSSLLFDEKSSRT